MNKTFKGKLKDGGQDRIRLSTNQGLVGYRIVKFELMAGRPMQLDGEHIVQVFTREQTNVPTGTSVTVDYHDPLLLACGIISNETTGHQYPVNLVTFFDNKTVNQDIFVTHTDVSGSGECNYYIELELIKLSLDESTVATLKDMRGRE